jgi:hypothetical protein
MRPSGLSAHILASHSPLFEKFKESTMKLNVMKYLDCSTGHVSKKTKNWLDWAAGTNVVGQTIGSYEFGFFISVPPTGEFHEDIPADLRQLLDVARGAECALLRLDADGDYIDGIPTYAD